MGDDITKLFENVNKLLLNAPGLDKQITDFINVLLTIVGSYMICWIMYRGYQILWGKSNDNVKDFLWDAFVKFIFIYICLFPDDWLKLVKEAINGLRDAFSDTTNLVQMLQDYYNKGINTVVFLVTDPLNATIVVGIYSLICAVIVMLGCFAGLFAFGFALLINQITFYLLLVIMPFAFYCLIFGNFLKPIFTQWWNLMLSSVLTLLFLQIFGGTIFLIIGKFSFQANELASFGNEYYKVAGYFVLSGFILKVMTNLITSLVEKIVGISLESSAQGAVRGGLASAGGALGAGLFVGKSAVTGGFSTIKGGLKLRKWAFDKFKGKGGK